MAPSRSSTAILLACLSVLAVLAAAVPAPTLPRGDIAKTLPRRNVGSEVLAAAGYDWNHKHAWSTPSSQHSSSNSKTSSVGTDNGHGGAQCDLSKAQLPQNPSSPSSTPLPKPSGPLAHVLIGRGTQNYSCADAAPSSKPSPVGALASLYDASCTAATLPQFLELLPSIALEQPDPNPYTQTHPAEAAKYKDDKSKTESQRELVGMKLVGHHYFVDSKSPVFNLDTDVSGDLGYVQVKKVGEVDAPQGAMKGVNGRGDGACAWLYLSNPEEGIGRKRGLERRTDGQKTFSDVYRVNTAGGNAPDTCEGMAASFQVEYAAEYWFYGS